MGQSEGNTSTLDPFLLSLFARFHGANANEINVGSGQQLVGIGFPKAFGQGDFDDTSGVVSQSALEPKFPIVLMNHHCCRSPCPYH